ncbi:MAG TPA: DUF3410 domain-containing protein [Kiritimatiellia bacterium]|nr:DUF3410 domain-containing protein [Kiritimatiellia bacterium]HMO99557.1 DUF3410 domain-containing protein [Kiritimatiellia bacterium]HMP97449.1 DUF3410 domain-containing protein [Kiritimatiellia bacterium]
MSRPRIVCATSLADGEAAFSSLGDVRMMAESDIHAGALRDVDALITRSKVRVDDNLLADSRLQFYATATAGIDHIDVAALARRGIAWAHAPGSNANSVAEYIIAALAWLGRERGINWTRRTLAIIGAGQVGSRLAALADRMGLTVLLNDPPLRDATGDSLYLPLREALAHADIVSLHVPLTASGPHATRNMVTASWLSNIKPGAVFINSSRGEVVEEPALLRALADGNLSAAILDVFNREPAIDIATLRAAALATPHIAGYSLDGRRQGTLMVYRAACRHFNRPPTWQPPEDAEPTELNVHLHGDESRALHDAVLAAYNPFVDDQRLRALPVGMPIDRHFQRVRQTCVERREFRRYRVSAAALPPAFAALLKKIGFCVSGIT